MIYTKSKSTTINVQENVVNKMSAVKLNKDEVLYTTYYDQNGNATHILSKKINADANRMWILWSIEDDGSLKKVAHGSSPLTLEDKIPYIKAIKDS